MYTYTTIPDLIRAALGDEVTIEQNYNRDILIEREVKVKEVLEGSNFYTLTRGTGRTVLGVELKIEAYPPGTGGLRKVFRRIMLKDGKFDLDKFRAKYHEVIEAWKPHQEAIDARRAKLDEQAEIKAQRERYADAGPELVAALEFMKSNWNSPFDATRAEARQKAQDAITKTKAE